MARFLHPRYLCALALTGLLASAPANDAQAQKLTLDINSLTVQAYTGNAGAGAPTAFSPNFTGSLVVSFDSDSTLPSATLDGATHALTGSLTGFTAFMNMANGSVLGGSGLVSVANPDNTTDSYLFTIGDGISFVIPSFGMTMSQTHAGTFNHSTFDGINISAFLPSNGQLPGDAMLHFIPNASGLDSEASMELVVQAPEPATVALLALGLFVGLGPRKRPSAPPA